MRVLIIDIPRCSGKSIIAQQIMSGINDATILIGNHQDEVAALGISELKPLVVFDDFAYGMDLKEEKPKVLPPWKGNESWKKK